MSNTKTTETIRSIFEKKIVVIARNVAKNQIIDLAEALYQGGIRLMEITFDQSGKHGSDESIADNIRTLTDAFGDKMGIGAGTVMTEKQVELAHKAGAKFIISPNVCKEVIEKTVELNMVSIPGAMTPTEIETAKKFGADIVKMFPAGDLGLSYIKSIMAPMGHIPIIAVGGVNEDNISDFLKIGAVGVGVGSNIVKKDLLDKGDFEGITNLAKLYTNQI